ncbi:MULTISPECIES: TlpA disulfide reductase family protein [Planococcus]|uniref:Thiol-disulfide oxidoreductase n=2 Tax=Planococcus TaxID=1372 RepID=A0ABM5WUL0_9BACL|nr:MULTISPECIES: TlpA disulfide reductase family protein [Planococcus]ALS78041.1 thiol-disulfide oxidoreductase [Planococcus kocurii]AQU80056.1 thiol-disulfide oxidoreductase [Planococcus faecalis]KAA0958568.1 TlpA family protein disulfide reductase [Planococcus sp. ANT_H30]MDJ0330573.1 TlpA disulfide reductase family protein [Planococcus sp. S3-L1]OHX51169.1 thiol-disulfide oxidoreductase [Planococcus faecalis]
MPKKIIGLLVLATMVVLVIIGAVKNNMAESEALDNMAIGSNVDFLPTDEGLAKGEKAPDFQLTTLDGQEVTLSDYQGQKVLLNFWATWCPPCRAEMPHMQSYFEEHAEEENVVILSVNLTTEDKGLEEIEEFVEEFGLEFAIPMDEKGDVGATYQAVSIPTSYMIDTKGRIQNKVVGPMDLPMMEKLVEAME